MIAGQDFSVSIFQCADGIKLICHRTIILPGVMDTLWPTTTAGTADFPWRFDPLSIIAKAYMGGITGTIHKNHRVVQTVGKHIIAQDALTSRNNRIRIDESAQFGIVITGLEVVEGGFGILRLSMQCLRWFRLYPDEITKYRLGRDQGDIAVQNLMRIILECCGILV